MARTPDPKSKAGFVRKQPISMSAADVVKAGKASGIKLDIGYVYSVRGAAKKKRSSSKQAFGPSVNAILVVKPGPGGSHERTSALASGGSNSSGLVAEIERIVEAKVSAILRARFGALLG